MKAVEDFERQTASQNTDNKSNELSKEGKYMNKDWREKNAIRKILNFKRKKIKKQKSRVEQPANVVLPNKKYVLPNKMSFFLSLHGTQITNIIIISQIIRNYYIKL